MLDQTAPLDAWLRRAIMARNRLELGPPVIDVHPRQLVLHPDVHLRFNCLRSLQGHEREVDVADTKLMSVGKRGSTYRAEATFHLGRGSMHRQFTTEYLKVGLIYRAPCHEGGARRPPAAFTMAKAVIPNGFGNGEANSPAETFARVCSFTHNCALLAPYGEVIPGSLPQAASHRFAASMRVHQTWARSAAAP